MVLHLCYIDLQLNEEEVFRNIKSYTLSLEFLDGLNTV